MVSVIMQLGNGYVSMKNINISGGNNWFFGVTDNTPCYGRGNEGSSPSRTTTNASVVKWYHTGLQNQCWGFESLLSCNSGVLSNGCSADCKSVAFRHWGFESLHSHTILDGVEVAQQTVNLLVTGSNPVRGATFIKMINIF